MTRVEVDHTPGGSPEPSAAPAPSRTVAPSFTTRPNSRRRSGFLDPDRYMEPRELFSAELRNDPASKDGTVTVYSGYAMAAARLNLRGAVWSEDDRAECAGWIAAEVTGAAKAPRRGTAADVLRWIDYAERHPLTVRQHETAIPRRLATMTRLGGMAANWRRSEERRRDRDHRAETARVVLEGFTATAEGEQEGAAEVTGYTLRPAEPRHATPMRQPHGSPADVLRYIDVVETVRDRCTAWPIHWGAALREDSRPAVALGGPRMRAVSMLRGLGLPGMGAAYPAAYAAALSATGIDGAAMAAAMGCSVETAKKRVQRARHHIPSAKTHGYLTHADVLGVTVEEERVQHGLKVTEGDWRTEAHDRDACTCSAREDTAAAPLECPAHPVAERRAPGGRRRRWDGKRSAEWTRSLKGSTRARMAAAAGYREARRDA